MPPDPGDADSPIHHLLQRTDAERARENRYRMAQSMVFGSCVIALDWFGDQLGGRDAGLWSGTFQLLLSAWVLYVAAAGMAFEGIVRLCLRPRQFSWDLPVALTAAALWLFALTSLALGFAAARADRFYPHPAGRGFELSVWLIILWTAIRYRYFQRRAGQTKSSITAEAQRTQR